LRAEILCVGSELLLGQIIDTNAAYLGGQLARIGLDVHRKQTVGDNLARITDCIRASLSRADVLIITGGLGPTTDDLTREAIAGALDVGLEHQPDLEQGLRDFFAKRGIAPSTGTMRQAYLPAGTCAIPNSNGTAPGVQAETADGKMVFAVPGVPREMKAMMDLSIIPTLLERSEGERNIIVSRLLRAFGIGESSLAEPIEDILTTAENPTVAPLIYGNTEVHLRLTAKARNEAEAKELLDDMEATIRERVGDYIFGIDDQTLPSVVVAELAKRHLTLGVAESITGGLIQAMLTDVPGSSKVLRGGVVAYTDETKHNVLGVPPQTIADGVVTAATAEAMAEGARRLLHADIGLSTTGEAGPTSGSGAAVGSVFIGLNDGQSSQAFERDFHGDRDAIRKRSALAALDYVRRHLMNAA